MDIPLRNVTLSWLLVSLLLAEGCTLSSEVEQGFAEVKDATCKYPMDLVEVDDSTFTYRMGGQERRIVLQHDSLCHYSGDTLLDAWTFSDPIYQFDCGDLTGDSLPEIAVGVVRSTRFRPERDKRLFIFKLWKGVYIRPLWFGSRLGLPLEDFCVVRDSVPGMVHTWERRSDGRVEAIYRLKGFGLHFVKYINVPHTENKSYDYLHQPHR